MPTRRWNSFAAVAAAYTLRERFAAEAAVLRKRLTSGSDCRLHRSALLAVDHGYLPSTDSIPFLYSTNFSGQCRRASSYSHHRAFRARFYSICRQLLRTTRASRTCVSALPYLLQALCDFVPSTHPHLIQLMTRYTCLLYTSPSPRDKRQSRMPSSA